MSITNAVASAIDQNSFLLSWDYVDGANSFSIVLDGQSTDVHVWNLLTTSPTSSFEVSNLESNHQYAVTIIAYSMGQEMARSTTIYVKTSANKVGMTGTIALSGENIILATVTGQQHRITSYMINNAGTTDVTIMLKAGTVERYKVLLKPGSVFSKKVGALSEDYIGCPMSTAATVMLSDTVTINYDIEYTTA